MPADPVASCARDNESCRLRRPIRDPCSTSPPGRRDTESTSGETCSPHHSMSSPVFTMTVSSSRRNHLLQTLHQLGAAGPPVKTTIIYAPRIIDDELSSHVSACPQSFECTDGSIKINDSRNVVSASQCSVTPARAIATTQLAQQPRAAQPGRHIPDTPAAAAPAFVPRPRCGAASRADAARALQD